MVVMDPAFVNATLVWDCATSDYPLLKAPRIRMLRYLPTFRMPHHVVRRPHCGS